MDARPLDRNLVIAMKQHPSALRGHSAAAAEARYIPGQKSPIDLPDDFGLDEGAPHFGVATIIAAAVWVVLIIAAIVIWGAVA